MRLLAEKIRHRRVGVLQKSWSGGLGTDAFRSVSSSHYGCSKFDTQTSHERPKSDDRCQKVKQCLESAHWKSPSRVLLL